MTSADPARPWRRFLLIVPSTPPLWCETRRYTSRWRSCAGSAFLREVTACRAVAWWGKRLASRRTPLVASGMSALGERTTSGCFESTWRQCTSEPGCATTLIPPELRSCCGITPSSLGQRTRRCSHVRTGPRAGLCPVHLRPFPEDSEKIGS